MVIPVKGMEFISQGSTLRFQVQGSRFRVYRAQGSGSRSWGLGCRIYLGFRAQDFTLYLNPQMSCLVGGGPATSLNPTSHQAQEGTTLDGAGEGMNLESSLSSFFLS